MQGAFAQLAEPAENQLPSRVMFKPYMLAEDTSFDAAFMDRLPTEHQGLRRRLMEASGGQQIQIQSLGQHTGMNMIEVPQGVNISDVLKALQDHPGVPCSTPACTFSSPGHARMCFPRLGGPQTFSSHTCKPLQCSCPLCSSLALRLTSRHHATVYAAHPQKSLSG